MEESPPNKIDKLPDIEPSSVLVNGSRLSKANNHSKAITSNDISRTFLAESNSTLHEIIIDNDSIDTEVVIQTERELESCNLHFDVQSSGGVCLRLLGKSNWFGLSITGVLQHNVNFSFAIVNDLNEKCTLLRCEDWDIFKGLIFGVR